MAANETEVEATPTGETGETGAQSCRSFLPSPPLP